MSVSFPLHWRPPNNGKGLSHVLTLVFLHSELQLPQDDQPDQEPFIGVLGLKHVMLKLHLFLLSFTGRSHKLLHHNFYHQVQGTEHHNHLQ